MALPIRFLERHRVPIVAGTLIVAVLGLPLLYFLHFDFNPITCAARKVESIATISICGRSNTGPMRST